MEARASRGRIEPLPGSTICDTLCHLRAPCRHLHLRPLPLHGRQPDHDRPPLRPPRPPQVLTRDPPTRRAQRETTSTVDAGGRCVDAEARGRCQQRQRTQRLRCDGVSDSGARDAQPYLGARTWMVRRQDDRSGAIPAGVACGRSVSQGRPGRWALAAGGLGEPAEETPCRKSACRALDCQSGPPTWRWTSELRDDVVPGADRVKGR